MNFKNQIGQSFVEVIVIVAIVALIVSGLVAGTVASIKSTTFSSQKAQATKYAQEGLELSRLDRDKSWGTFYGRRGAAWCLDKAGAWTQGVSCPQNIDGIYSRTITFTWDGTRMQVDAVVSWLDGANSHTSKISTYLTQWR